MTITIQQICSLESLETHQKKFLSDIEHGVTIENISDALATNGVNIFHYDSRIYTPLSWAAWHKNFHVVQAIISIGHGSKPILNRASLNTALHEACRSGHLATINLLISTMTVEDVNQVDDDGLTAGHYASRSGFVQVLQTLHTAGTNWNQFSAQGLLPIHEAAHFGHLKALQFLLGYISPNHPDRTSHGWNILHRAARYGHVPICRYLTVRAICDLEQVDRSGLTALDLARRYHQHAVAAVFESIRKRAEPSVSGYHSDQSSIDTDRDQDPLSKPREMSTLTESVTNTESIKQWKSAARPAEMIQIMSKELANIRTMHLRQLTRLETIIADKDRSNNETQQSVRLLQKQIDRQKEEIDALRSEIRQYQSGARQGRALNSHGAGSSSNNIAPEREGLIRPGPGRYTRVHHSSNSAGTQCIKIENVQKFPNLNGRYSISSNQ